MVTLKSYLEVVKSDPYNGTPIGKLEYIGNYTEELEKNGEFKELNEDEEQLNVESKGKKAWKQKRKKPNPNKIKQTDRDINK